MLSPTEDIANVSGLIRKDFGLSQDDISVHNEMEALHLELTRIISYLIDKDFNRLLNAMYRIDISEEKLKKALAIDPPDKVAPTIATLIIDRELQKVLTRRKYKE